jgi:hypothetical protein
VAVAAGLDRPAVRPRWWQVCVEDMAVAVRKDGSKPTPRTPHRNLYYPLCFRDSSEIRMAGGAR